MPPPPHLRFDLDTRWGATPVDSLAAAVSLYLAAPGVLFVTSWFQPWVSATAGLSGVLALACAPGWRCQWPLGKRITLLCAAAGLVWAAATGCHHLVYSTADWQIRDAVLRDLSLGPWPVAYAEVAGGPHWLLRAPVGYYLPAGLVGQVFGVPVAQVALWLWSAAGFALTLMLLAALAAALALPRPGRSFAVLASVFMLFGGLDVVPNLWLDSRAGAGLLASWGRGGEWWARLFQYTGHVTATLWVPNHALPAWLLALLLLRHERDPGFQRGLVVAFAGAAFWSPLAATAAAVLAAAALLRAGRSALLRGCTAPANLLAAIFAVPICLYLVAGTGGVPHYPLLSRDDTGEAFGRWALFLTVEVLCWAALASVLLRSWLLAASVVMLCLLPAYVFGPGNEMTSRGGLSPVAILAAASGAALRVPITRPAARIARYGLLACMAIMAAGSSMEASPLITKPAWSASPHCSLIEAARQSVFQATTDWAHYLVPWPDDPLAAWMRVPQPRLIPGPIETPPCWPTGGP
ncbi:hypothetical protein GXW71_08920 [Roseomonas hellenica]|uniref:Uncharacterized protein n=1 Tax=Plastoroseomonas hellenica TaxID=2687306 RepID=A0ABS5EW16_9PROT|nr:hypothetical protein [Plastoroseomonas hellenica]MBR0664474.1 hypothetical protein [Plastoroseomonas hellenica]